MTTSTKSANVWTFEPDAVTVNGRTFAAAYSIAKSGDVYVFATVKAAADAADVPVRLHISATMPMHADAAWDHSGSGVCALPTGTTEPSISCQTSNATKPFQTTTARVHGTPLNSKFANTDIDNISILTYNTVTRLEIERLTARPWAWYAGSMEVNNAYCS